MREILATCNSKISRVIFFLFITVFSINVNANNFKPSLGINTEAPQAESDIAGQAMPFADIFRTARPFKELSTGITIDENGWPMSIAAGGQAKTKLLQAISEGSIPAGDYFVLYEGTGNIGFTGNHIVISPLPLYLRSEGFLGRTLTLHSDSNELNVVISGITEGEGNYIRNIRIIMPGGICGSELTNRVDNESDCPTGQPYQSFVDTFKNDREAIIFNPDYLDFLKDFRVVRMMNLMEASPGISSCRNGLGILVEDCVTHTVTWQDRAKLSDAVWGGSSRTGLSGRADVTNEAEHKGVPVEVLVELANQLKVSPWFTMPHAADDDYVSHFSAYISNNLNINLEAYIEYSNEVWNSGFIGFHYVQSKGIEAGFNTIPAPFDGAVRDANYFARLRYYSKRSVEIFNLWETAFTGTSRLVRVVGTSQGDTVLSERILAYENAVSNGKIDALAMAPYFFGCVDRTGSCEFAPKILSEVTTVDDVFDVIDQDFSVDPLGMAGAVEKINRQAQITSANNIQLLAYEGGQHLTIMGSMGSFSEEEKERLRDIFKQANRDARMKDRYLSLLDAWKAEVDNGATLFTLYTLPQTYYRYGNWGLKEHLNKTRAESPKYDAVMTFQETVVEPWWNYDADSDGYTDEINVPSYTGAGKGDGDGDGVADIYQSYVTSLLSQNGSHWLSYRNNHNGLQTNFSVSEAPLTLPADKHLLHGVVQYDLDVASGGTISVEVYVDKDTAIQDYYLLSNDGNWVAQNAVITHTSNKTKLVFSITEGGNFDRDATANGILQLAQGGAMVSSGLDAWPYAYLFGNVELGQQTEAKAFTIKNTGSRNLTISNASITGNNAGEFSVTDNTCTTLAANETCTISASFQPNSIGSKSAMLTVATDDPDNANINIFLCNHEADKEESERRLPPVLNSFTLKNQSGEDVSTMQSNTQYTVHWSILGYHENYTSLVVMFNCTGIADNTSCGDSYSDSSRFLTSGTVTSSSPENGIWFHGDVQSKIFNYSHAFTTPSYATSTPIVIRFYRKNSKDLQVGNGSLSLIIPGNQAENYYDTTGRRVKNEIAP